MARTIRTRLRQEGPSANLDDNEDPLAPRYRLIYEIDTDEPGIWLTITEDEARQLLAEGEAVILP